MNYKDTLIKQVEINWKASKIKYTKDGKIDLKINIPLTELCDLQAKKSFMRGVAEALSFVGHCQTKKTVITTELLDTQFAEWGITELGDMVKSKK